MLIRSVMLMSAVVASVSACDSGDRGDLVAEPGTTAPPSGKSDGGCRESSALTKNLPDTQAVPVSQHIGRPIADALASELIGATLTGEHSVPADEDYAAGGGWRDYATRDGALNHEWRVYQDGRREEFVRIYAPGAGMPLRVHADHDGDGRVDSWDDDQLGQFEGDWNRDGRVDWMGQTVATLENFVFEGYEKGWVPPAFPAMRILEDTDFDGFFNEESVTGGKDPAGHPSWWSRGCQ